MIPEKMITQAKTCQDLVQCAFSLNEFEVMVYNKLVETGPMRADDLADLMNRDRSTVYRALQKMMTCGMCFRETKSIERGGYFHVYRAISRAELKGKLQECVDDWYGRMQNVLSRFEQ
ncbi:MAG: Sugar-specific transcriptional regulator TrmB [Methanomassiliicoccales archaeon PtaU1.Bin124]|nr:MAG: Sugar-specific transcriptional regulator TrmB [Methanomassiliicoccales archaeon PtaU1.Bin124]